MKMSNGLKYTVNQPKIEVLGELNQAEAKIKVSYLNIDTVEELGNVLLKLARDLGFFYIERVQCIRQGEEDNE
jgi:hypothetical protein